MSRHALPSSFRCSARPTTEPKETAKNKYKETAGRRLVLRQFAGFWFPMRPTVATGDEKLVEAISANRLPAVLSDRPRPLPRAYCAGGAGACPNAGRATVAREPSGAQAYRASTSHSGMCLYRQDLPLSGDSSTQMSYDQSQPLKQALSRPR